MIRIYLLYLCSKQSNKFHLQDFPHIFMSKYLRMTFQGYFWYHTEERKKAFGASYSGIWTGESLSPILAGDGSIVEGTDQSPEIEFCPR